MRHLMKVPIWPVVIAVVVVVMRRIVIMIVVLRKSRMNVQVRAIITMVAVPDDRALSSRFTGVDP